MEIKGAGGTPGGVGLFLGGLAMMVVGGYLLLQQVQVDSGFWHWFGPNTFGLSLVPLLVGIGFLFRGFGLLFSGGEDGSRGWSIFGGILMLIGGVVVLVYPYTSVATLAWVAGIWLVIGGIFEIIAAFKLRSLAKAA